MRDPYEVLNVSPYATDEQVKQAYREMTKKYHPDLYEKSTLSDVANEKMKSINEAYDEIMRIRAQRSADGFYAADSAGSSSYGEYYSAYNDAKEHIRLGKYRDAFNSLHSIPNAYRNAEWYYLFGVACRETGQHVNARHHFEKAVNMDPSNAVYKEALDNMSENMNRYGGYNTNRSGDSCNVCNICSSLICADCCCECMGGDLIPCC